MIKVYARVALVGVGALAFGCKSQEEKQVEAARAQLATAQAQAAAAQAQLAKAEQQMAESAAKVGEQGAALGAQGAALGMEAAAAGMQAATAALNNMATSMGKAGAKGPLVDFRALKALLPESIGGLRRVSASGEKGAAMGMGASHAEGRYKGDGQAQLTVKLVDTAGLGGLAMAAFGLATVEIDKETEHGYERTSTLGGHKAFEKYDNQSKRGEIKLLVANRFVVEVDGDDIPMEAIKEAVSKIDVGKLQALGAAAK